MLGRSMTNSYTNSPPSLGGTNAIYNFPNHNIFNGADNE
jgi:hypothetical protein